MKRVLLATVCGLMFLAPAYAAYQEDLAQLTRGMPREIREFIDRRANCNHWFGEEPYDQDRRHQIEAAIKQLRCDLLEPDEAMLKRRYASTPQIVKALDESRDWSPG